MTAAPTDLRVRVRSEIDWPRFEYTEARSIEQVNRHAAAGWRVHTALLVPGSAAKLYLMERPRVTTAEGHP